MMTFRGRVWLFGDNVDTDVIAPGKWMNEAMDILKVHAFEAVRPGFYQLVRPGDMIVAGRSFGYGSHREQANTVLKALGITMVIAESMARIYFRNCLALGMPAVILPGITDFVKEGDEIEVSLSPRGGSVVKPDGTSLLVPPLPEMVFNMVEQGGIEPLIRDKIKAWKNKEA